jgi:hypothetical protein
MWVPEMTDEEGHALVHGGAWIGKLATHGPDGTIRMTPPHYASVLIDSPTEPYRGVHLVGEAEVRPATASPQKYADRFAAYIEDREEALQMIVMLRNIAPRVG